LRCARECLESSRKIDNVPSPNISRGEKKTLTRWPISAVENFIEMRDKTASKTFRAKKSSITCSKVCCPASIWPLYTMVHSRASLTRKPRAARDSGSHRLRGLIAIASDMLLLVLRLLAT